MVENGFQYRYHLFQVVNGNSQKYDVGKEQREYSTATDGRDEIKNSVEIKQLKNFKDSKLFIWFSILLKNFYVKRCCYLQYLRNSPTLFCTIPTFCIDPFV